jgi:hypothetical protein
MRFRKLTTAATAVLALTLLTGLVAPASRAEVSFDFFYSDLSPHGSWLVSTEYGRVWQPAVYHRGWNPYYDGHWVYTDCGWTWVSDYAWGDVPYHYGTWVDDASIGWAWVPGYTWAPAWVTFRTGPDFVGWAPVAPGFSVGFSSGGFSFGASLPVATSAFVFVPTRHFAAPRVRSYIVPEARRTALFQSTTVVTNLSVRNNVIINNGPGLRVVEQASGRTFRPQSIERVARVAPFTSVRRDQLAIARERTGGRVRAAEPISAQQPLPPRMSEQARRDYRKNPQRSREPRPEQRSQLPSSSQQEAQLQQERMRERPQQRQRQQAEPQVAPQRTAPRVTPPPPRQAPKKQKADAKKPPKSVEKNQGGGGGTHE